MSSSDLQWSVKNGDLDAVTAIVENEVGWRLPSLKPRVLRLPS